MWISGEVGGSGKSWGEETVIKISYKKKYIFNKKTLVTTTKRTHEKSNGQHIQDKVQEKEVHVAS